MGELMKNKLCFHKINLVWRMLHKATYTHGANIFHMEQDELILLSLLSRDLLIF